MYAIYLFWVWGWLLNLQKKIFFLCMLKKCIFKVWIPQPTAWTVCSAAGKWSGLSLVMYTRKGTKPDGRLGNRSGVLLSAEKQEERDTSEHLNKFPRGSKNFPAIFNMDFSFIPTRHSFSHLTKDLQWQLKWFPNREHTIPIKWKFRILLFHP